MPTYYAAGVSARLMISSLSASTTAAPSLRSGHNAQEKLLAAETTLQNGKTLREEALPCLGEKAGLHFLGRWGEAPFLCVGVDLARQPEAVGATKATGTESSLAAQLSDSVDDGDSSLTALSSSLTSLESTPQRSPEINAVKQKKAVSKGLDLPSNGKVNESESRAKAVVARKKDQHLPDSRHEHSQKNSLLPSIDPTVEACNALTLSVDLMEKSFSRLKKLTASQDLKVDVFLNGQLTHSMFVPSRLKVHQSERSMWFSGRRVGRVLENAWVLRMKPRELLSEEPVSASANCAKVQKRWDDIGTALQAEVDLLGFNYKRNRPPTAEYLDGLAKMQLPEALVATRMQDGARFAVVDVVVTLGTGKKYPTSKGYLVKPERLRDERFFIPVSSAAKTPPTPINLSELSLDVGQPNTNPSSVPVSKTILNGRPPGGLPWATKSSIDLRSGNVPAYPGPAAVAPSLPGLVPKKSAVPPKASGPSSVAQRRATISSISSIGGLQIRSESSIPPFASYELGFLQSARSGGAGMARRPEIVGRPARTAPLQLQRSRSWSFRSDKGAKTPVSGPAVQDKLRDTHHMMKTGNKQSMILINPYGSPYETPSPHESPLSKKSKLNTAVQNNEAPLLPQLPTLGADNTTMSVALAHQSFHIAAQEQKTGELIYPIAHIDLKPTISQATLALREGVSPTGLLMSTIIKGLGSSSPLCSSFPPTSNLETVSRPTQLAPLNRLARRSSLESDGQGLGMPRIAIADGQAAIYYMGDAKAHPPQHGVSPGLNSIAGSFQSAVNAQRSPELTLPMMRSSKAALSGVAAEDVTEARVTKDSMNNLPVGSEIGMMAEAKGRNNNKGITRTTKRKRKRSGSNINLTVPESLSVASAIPAPTPFSQFALPPNAGSNAALGVKHDVFAVPALSNDCVITYASADDAGASQGVRQVRAERGGVFHEMEVLLGIRFVVGVGFGLESVG